MSNIRLKTAALGVALLGFGVGPAFADAPDAPAAAPNVDERITKLEEELNLLKRQREVEAEINDAAAATRPTITIDKKGFKATSIDKKYEFSVTGTFQLDRREYLGDKTNVGRDEFLARRLRPTFNLKAGNLNFRLTPDFAGSAVTFFDAYADYKVNNAINFRVGKSKTPVGLERNQSASDLVFVERNFATNLAPTRDFGAQLFGTFYNGVVEYQVGVYNGGADLSNLNNDSDEQKDVFARVFVTPFANSDIVILQGFGVGLAGSKGEREGTTGTTQLGTYRTPGQLDFFRYATNVFASGEHTRFNPQTYWYFGPLGLQAEYIESKQRVALGATKRELTHEALSVTGSWVLTGEDNNFKGGVKPKADFDLSNGTWGALELGVRYGYTDVDDLTFPTFASLTASASKAEGYGVGLGWYLSENLKLVIDYDQTSFTRGAAVGDRLDEKFLSSRVQVRF